MADEWWKNMPAPKQRSSSVNYYGDDIAARAAKVSYIATTHNGNVEPVWVAEGERVPDGTTFAEVVKTINVVFGGKETILAFVPQPDMTPVESYHVTRLLGGGVRGSAMAFIMHHGLLRHFYEMPPKPISALQPMLPNPEWSPRRGTMSPGEAILAWETINRSGKLVDPTTIKILQELLIDKNVVSKANHMVNPIVKDYFPPPEDEVKGPTNLHGKINYGSSYVVHNELQGINAVIANSGDTPDVQSTVKRMMSGMKQYVSKANDAMFDALVAQSKSETSAEKEGLREEIDHVVRNMTKAETCSTQENFDDLMKQLDEED
jgi:hypothetical protein